MAVEPAARPVVAGPGPEVVPEVEVTLAAVTVEAEVEVAEAGAA